MELQDNDAEIENLVYQERDILNKNIMLKEVRHQRMQAQQPAPSESIQNDGNQTVDDENDGRGAPDTVEEADNYKQRQNDQSPPI